MTIAKINIDYLSVWGFNLVGSKLTLLHTFEAHKGYIMDIVEVTSRGAAATCSFDCRIRIWDLLTGTKIGSLKPYHQTGIKGLDYTPDFGSLIISIACENEIKVWSPEVSINNAYIGSLEGHTSTLAAAKFIKNSPNLISIDERDNIKIWDVRKLTCVQSIIQQHKKDPCNGICMFGEQNKFIIYKKSLTMYEMVTDKTTKNFNNSENDT